MRSKYLPAILLSSLLSFTCFAGQTSDYQNALEAKSQILSQLEQLQTGKLALQKQVTALLQQTSELGKQCRHDNLMLNVAAVGMRQSFVAGVIGGVASSSSYHCQQLKTDQSTISQKQILLSKFDVLISHLKQNLLNLNNSFRTDNQP
jgi:hypothetical protein|tara:strand:- start:26636 stop:27079 length:444 start_codon:yes stop_codon:yes gene_type:complete